jgi:hypothetical protein
MTRLPAYLWPRPAMPTDAATLSDFDALYERALLSGGALLTYDLAPPLWQFLCHVTDTRDVLLHGSGNANIAVFEPRKSSDVNEFGNRTAVYAASDGIWPLYFAVLDRERFDMLLVNASVRAEFRDGSLSAPHYYFSITEAALRQRPFRTGTVYLLPRAGFEQQRPQEAGELIIHLPQWASASPVRPLARMKVDPGDFPFLDLMRGHDDEQTLASARRNPDGFPWVG